ncbi:Putative helicase mov-10-B.1 [Leucoagaricus sp. SymC.cos]|nr:Putative helicase mov-10-B.1 [Leucoagaricus sp. SymC.cos]
MALNCPNILSSGTCTLPDCNYNHNVWACDVCNFVAHNTRGYERHLESRKHRNVLAGNVSRTWYCHICSCPVQSGVWEQHKAGRRHRGMAELRGSDIHIEPDPNPPTQTHTVCNLCQSTIPVNLWQMHLNSRNHRGKEQYAVFKTAVEETEKEKNGVTVEGDADFGIIDPAVGERGEMVRLKVILSVPLARITLVSVKLSGDIGSQWRRVASPFSVKVEGELRRLSNTRPIVLNVTFIQGYIGRYQDRIELQFEDEQLRKSFIISRTARAIVGDRAAHEELKPRAPYVPRVRLNRQPETHVVEGVAAPSLNAIPYVTRLPLATIPKHLLSTLALSSYPTKDNLNSIKRGFLPQTFDSTTHGRHFEALLWIEEHKMEQDLERYDMEGASLSRYNQYYYLAVPGLAEKRPSVLIGDRILVRKQTDAEGHWYAGHVHVVRKEEVGLVFHQTFRGWSTTQKYHVRFKLTRIPLQRQHQALATVFTESRILFPRSSHLSMISIPQVIPRTVDKLIQTNQAQLQAVSSIVAAAPGSLPFIVFGPPGTGKTITIVEAIIQLVKKSRSTRILACAPSNSAADLIATRLVEHLGKDDLFRMYAPSRDEKQMPDVLKDYSYYRSTGGSRPCFSIPPMATMKRYRVIVSTLISASIVFGIGIPRGHYSHIFIDEAGQATEPEAFVCIKTMADPSTNVVLSGDPKQLGPIIRSGISIKLGLELSYIERLMACSPYELNVGHGKSIVKLVKNFRSHKAILKFPNERFYGNDLQPCGDSKVINAYLKSSYLPNKNFPVIFHAVSGKDDREAASPSFFNVDEVLQVKSYIQQLKSDRVFRTSDHDIGVITPYHAQCLKIRAALRGVADEVKVGSVEEFQGDIQERKVILISTVRSSKEFVAYDIKHTLGFVASPRRFNVSITRAKALLIVIGDPNVLGLDPLWRSFLNYIYTNDGWKGPEIPWDPSEPVNEAGGYDASARNSANLDMNEFTRRMESMTIGGVEDDPDAGVDKPWREME